MYLKYNIAIWSGQWNKSIKLIVKIKYFIKNVSIYCICLMVDGYYQQRHWQNVKLWARLMFLDAHACFQPLRGVCAQLKWTAGLQSDSSSLSLPLCLSASACAWERGKCFYPDSWACKIWLLGRKTVIAKCEYHNNQSVKQVTYYTDYTWTEF